MALQDRGSVVAPASLTSIKPRSANGLYIFADPMDVSKDLNNCKAVLVDLCAPTALLESFMDNFNCVDREIPVILALSNCGACDRRRNMAMRILEVVNVAMISGRMGDIVAVTQAILEKDVSPLESLSDDSGDEACKKGATVTCNNGNSDAESSDHSALIPVMRRAKLKHQQANRRSKTVQDLADTDRGRGSTQAAVMPLHRSPICNSTPSPRGARKCINMKKNKGFERVPTILPIVGMKGQFRETQMSHVKVGDALEYAQKLCARTNTYVHLYETNTVTSGELVIEIMNTQVGMGNLHSTLPCSAGIAAAVLACVQCIPEYERILVEHCSRALSLFYVAASKATYEACKNENGLVSPGTLRQSFIDILHSLSPQAVKSLSEFVAHSVGLKTSRD